MFSLYFHFSCVPVPIEVTSLSCHLFTYTRYNALWFSFFIGQDRNLSFYLISLWFASPMVCVHCTFHSVSFLIHWFITFFVRSGWLIPFLVLAWPKQAPARHHKTGGHFLISYLFHLLIRAIFHSYNFSIELLMYVFINDINFLANSNMVHSHKEASFGQSWERWVW